MTESIKLKRLLFILLALCLLVSTVAYAADLGDIVLGEEKQPIVITVYQGSRSITDSLTAKSPSISKESVLSAATSVSLKDVRYPYLVSGSEVTIQKFRCDEKMQICGYWISCTRNGREVATNSPVWISPPPYEVVVSDVYDSKTNIQTVTLKEDPKAAVESVLKGYCERQPLGKTVVGTKE